MKNLFKSELKENCVSININDNIFLDLAINEGNNIQSSNPFLIKSFMESGIILIKKNETNEGLVEKINNLQVKPLIHFLLSVISPKVPTSDYFITVSLGSSTTPYFIEFADIVKYIEETPDFPYKNLSISSFVDFIVFLERCGKDQSLVKSLAFCKKLDENEKKESSFSVISKEGKIPATIIIYVSFLDMKDYD